MSNESSSKMLPMVLYGHPHTRVGRVAWLLEELELPHTIEVIDFFSDQYDHTNSGNRRVPFLFDPNTESRLFESLAINTWLIQTYGSESTLTPANATEWGDLFKWSFWAMTELDMLLFEGLMYNAGVGHLLSNETYYMDYFDRTKTIARRDRIARELRFPIRVLDSALETGDGWLMGDRFTIADLNVSSVAFWISLQDSSDEPKPMAETFPYFGDWLARCMGRQTSPLARILRDRAAGDPRAQIDWDRAEASAEHRIGRSGPAS